MMPDLTPALRQLEQLRPDVISSQGSRFRWRHGGHFGPFLVTSGGSVIHARTGDDYPLMDRLLALARAEGKAVHFQIYPDETGVIVRPEELGAQDLNWKRGGPSVWKSDTTTALALSLVEALRQPTSTES